MLIVVVCVGYVQTPIATQRESLYQLITASHEFPIYSTYTRKPEGFIGELAVNHKMLTFLALWNNYVNVNRVHPMVTNEGLSTMEQERSCILCYS